MNTAIFNFLYMLGQRPGWGAVVVFFGETFPFLVVIFAGVFLLMHHEVLFAERPIAAFKEKWKEVSMAFIVSAFAWVLSKILKSLLHIARPFEADPTLHKLITPYLQYSFPSGHATFFSALALSIYFFHKRAGLLFFLFAILISAARVMAGVHSPVDILGGFALGILIAYFLRKV